MQFNNHRHPDRKLIPRWRSIDQTSPAELASTRKFFHQSTLADDFDEALERWQRRQTILNALDVIYIAVQFGEIKRSRGAIDQILKSDIVDDVKTIARNLIRIPSAIELENAEVSLEDHRKKIRELKQRTAVSPHDPISHVELSRLYTNQGQITSARAAMRKAVALAPANRYVLRSAVRFCLHMEEEDIALRLVKSIPLRDPWLLATQISVADLLDKDQRFAKAARKLLDSDTLDVAHTSELAAAIGTLELGHGNLRMARRLFRKSLVRPNENVVAQAVWASDRSEAHFDMHILQTAGAFEARAFHAIKGQEWENAVQSCDGWHRDEPFAARPVTFGSFVAIDLLGNFDEAERLCRSGIISNPSHSGIRNNLTYALLQKDRIDEAKKEWKLIKKPENEEERATFLATEGLLHFKIGDIDRGRSRYREAIETFTRINSVSQALRARIHHLRAEHSIDPNVLSERCDEVDQIKAQVAREKDTINRSACIKLLELGTE